MSEETSFCPKCGSARVDTSSLIGGVCTCRGCGWQGGSAELHKYQYDTGLLAGADAVTRFSMELRLLVAKDMSAAFGKFLVKWGFLPDKGIDVAVWGRYMNAIARAAAVAIVQTRDEIESEDKNGQ